MTGTSTPRRTFSRRDVAVLQKKSPPFDRGAGGRQALIRCAFCMPRERTARRRRTSHRLREIIGTRTHLCELFGHAGFDMRIRRAGAARRRQRELARYALRMLERRFRIRIVVTSRRIMDAENLEG